MQPPSASRKYTDEEKRQLLANLDLEVAHRCRQLEAMLQDHLEHFTIHQEGQVSRIPKQVRSMTMREFGEKYNGDIQLALRGFQKDRLAAAGADANFGEIDKSMRKRKFLENHDIERSVSRESDSRPLKTAKTAPVSPNKPKKPLSSTSSQPGGRLIRSSSKPPPMGIPRPISRIGGTPSPEKLRPPFNSNTSYNSRPSSRPTSPLKDPMSRVPSSSKFNPSLTKPPTFPPNDDQATLVRLPRKDENMLSVNGSPLANPYQFGMGWFKGVELAAEEEEDQEMGGSQQATGSRTLKRSKSSTIVVRRDPSAALHSRTTSQASLFTSSSQATASSSHSREPSQSSHGFKPNFRFPAGVPPTAADSTPKPLSKHSRSFSALVAIPTKDGHLLEFDPLQTSPSALDALEGITNSAKKQARIEMGRLVQAAVDKWKI